MKINRRARLPLLAIKPTGIDYLKKVLKTEPDQTLNHIDTMRNVENHETQALTAEKRENQQKL